jgi:geranylgeranyl reductase
LAGEAAGLTSRTTGEGITPALISGQEIGMKILDPAYKMPLLKELLKFKRRQEFFKKMTDTMPFMTKYFLIIFIKLIKIKRFQIYFEGKPSFKG